MNKNGNKQFKYENMKNVFMDFIVLRQTELCFVIG